MSELGEKVKSSMLDNSLGAVILSVLALIVIGFLSIDYWTYLFAVGVAWVISDFILNLVVRGGSGIAQIPLWGTQIQTKGRSFLAFLFAIFFGSWVSSYLSDFIFRIAGFAVASVTVNGATLSSSQVSTVTTILCSLLVGALAFVDFNTRFYK